VCAPLPPLPSLLENQGEKNDEEEFFASLREKRAVGHFRPGNPRHFATGTNFTQTGFPTATSVNVATGMPDFDSTSNTFTLSPSWLATSIHLPSGVTLKLRGVLIPPPVFQDVARAAEFALARLKLDKPASPQQSKTIGEITYEEAVKAALATKGDAKAGEQLFLKQGCVLCHTVSEKEPPKGPMLGGITTRYSRLELCESILKPSAKIAQGFESQRFTLKNGDQVDGFVVKESGDSVEVRNVAGTTAVLERTDIATREKREQSIMPEGLAANITPEELASLLAFLESTRAK
jgi:putative heme-binding domain-containing protein